MPLYLVATPIGCPEDITQRAQSTLLKANTIIFEERKESAAFLRTIGISLHDPQKKFMQLNEHSTPEDVEALAKICAGEDVALITDCGTPGFADPGADLVAACRKRGVKVSTLPGASSLMCLLSLTSARLSEFVFRGFLSAETEKRRSQWKDVAKESRAIVLMDTPYRLQKMIVELKEFVPQRHFLLALNLTAENEWIFEGLAKDCKTPEDKAEFMLLLYPTKDSSKKN